MKITVLVHGPWEDNDLDKIIPSLNDFCENNTHDEEIDMIIVSYVSDWMNLNDYLSTQTKLNYPINCVKIRDLFNPGFYNINRQICSVKAGLSKIEESHFVVKLRNDQSVNFKKLFAILRKKNFFCDDRKILTTNCYTRKDRLYHPSDMLLCGWQQELSLYYSVPVMKETSAEWKLHLLKILETDSANFEKECWSPESYLFTNYIISKGWKIERTVEDSYNAIKTYCYVVNSWNIDFKWNKKRIPGRDRGNLVLPMWGKWFPFGWDTMIVDENGIPYYEDVICYERSDFGGKRTKQDEYYINLSQELYLWAKMPDKNIYRFPFKKIKKDDKIVIYGAGCIGQTIHSQLQENRYSQIVLWTDSNYDRFPSDKGVSSPEELLKVDYDWILIAVENKKTAQSIKNFLFTLSIPEEKILWSNKW